MGGGSTVAPSLYQQHIVAYSIFSVCLSILLNALALFSLGSLIIRTRVTFLWALLVSCMALLFPVPMLMVFSSLCMRFGIGKVPYVVGAVLMVIGVATICYGSFIKTAQKTPIGLAKGALLAVSIYPLVMLVGALFAIATSIISAISTVLLGGIA